MTILCSQCNTYMGETDDPGRTLDFCRTCHSKWIAENAREANLLRQTMENLRTIMAMPRRGWGDELSKNKRRMVADA
jgi:hypothetical protein